ncbi:hypothetical protein [Nocardioides sp.]|uniref:hypothetical protein n=1 Tax=Nocardioides sp. TaxID=35761 RepID=UPI003511FFC7
MRGGLVRLLLGAVGLGALAGCSATPGADGAAAFTAWVEQNPFPAAEVLSVDGRDTLPGTATTSVRLRVADLDPATLEGTRSHLCGFEPPGGTELTASVAGPGLLVTLDCADPQGSVGLAALGGLARRPEVTAVSAIPTLVTLTYADVDALRAGLDRDAPALDPLVDPLFGRVELRGPGPQDDAAAARAIVDLPRELPAALRDAVAALLDAPALAALPGFRIVVDDPAQARLRLTPPPGADAAALAADLRAALAVLPAPVPGLDVAGS